MARSALAWLVVVGVLLPGIARAEVEVGDGVPFTASELESALLTRGVEPALTVRAVSGSTIEVRTPATAERIDLGGARGPAAARLVAVYLAEAPEPALATVEVRAPARRSRPVWLRVAAIAGRGAASDDLALIGPEAGVRTGRGRWQLGAELAWLHGQAADPGAAVRANLGLARIAIGAQVGAVELTAGPTLGRYGVGARRGWMRGGHVDAAVRVVGGATWRVRVGARAELLDPRVEVRLDGRAFTATPRLALTGAIAFEWAVAR